MKRELQTKLQDIKKRFDKLEQHSVAATKLLKEGVATLQREKVVRHPLKAWFFGLLAVTYHHRQVFETEVELVESYFAAPWADPPMSYELDLLDQLDIARDGLRRFVPEKGACEACDAQKQRLTRIESGDKLCDTCLQELNADTPAYPRASRKEIAKRRLQGFDVPDGVSILDCWKYEQILLRRQHGLRDDALYEELFNYLLACGLSRGGKWDWYCETSVVGGKYPNPDGTSRLDILRRCRVGERLQLIREPENSHQEDLRAVKVCRETGEQLGYIPTHLLGNDKNLGYCLANQMDRGDLFQATLQTISAKDKEGYAEFALKEGDGIGDVITQCERQRSDRFDTSTVTARIDVYWLNVSPPASEEEPQLAIQHSLEKSEFLPPQLQTASWISPPVIPHAEALEQVSHSEVVNTPLLEPLVEWSCPHCGASLTSPMQKVGMSGPCAFCRKTVVVPKPVPGGNPEYKPKTVEVRMVGLKTFQWPCLRCGLMNNTRLSSLGSRTRCKGCKLSIILPKTIGGF